MHKSVVIIPNWNGLDFIEACLRSLEAQTLEHDVIVVDNGSQDGSMQLVRDKFPKVRLFKFGNNAGFAGGVNRGIKPALAQDYEYIVLLNNDASAEPDWLEHLVGAADAHPEAGIIASKIRRHEQNLLDSTGEGYSIWGFPYPRGRDEVDDGQYDNQLEIFAGSGGASLYRADLFRQIGLFDEDFFAYFEDVDLSFRAQLAGWKVRYEPAAVVNHLVGGTSSKQRGNFARYHTVKNFMYLYTKNMPGSLYWRNLGRVWFAFLLMGVSDIRRLRFGAYLKGTAVGVIHLPKMIGKRWGIQGGRKVSTGYIDSLLLHEMPPTQKLYLSIINKLGLGKRGPILTIVIDARMYGPERWTGIGRYLQQLIAHLEQIDHENNYIILLGRDNFDDYSPAAPNFTKQLAPYPIYGWREQLGFAWFLYRLGADLVHFAAPNEPLLYFRRHITTIHDLTLLNFDTSRPVGLKRYITPVKRFVFRGVMWSVAHGSRAILTPTEYVKDQLKDRYHLADDKVTAAHLATEATSVAPAEIDRFNIPGAYILNVGNCYPYKNVGALVEAFASIADTQPGLSLVLAGRDDPFRDELRRLVRQRNLDARIIFTGGVSDEELAGLYQGAKLFVLPSLSEGFGFQGLEAMAAGVPVLAAYASCLPEVYGEAAAYFNPRDEADLAAKLTFLLGNDEELTRLRKAGAEHLHSFSWNKMARSTRAVYLEAGK